MSVLCHLCEQELQLVRLALRLADLLLALSAFSLLSLVALAILDHLLLVPEETQARISVSARSSHRPQNTCISPVVLSSDGWDFLHPTGISEEIELVDATRSHFVTLVTDTYRHAIVCVLGFMGLCYAVECASTVYRLVRVCMCVQRIRSLRRRSTALKGVKGSGGQRLVGCYQVFDWCRLGRSGDLFDDALRFGGCLVVRRLTN